MMYLKNKSDRSSGYRSVEKTGSFKLPNCHETVPDQTSLARPILVHYKKSGVRREFHHEPWPGACRLYLSPVLVGWNAAFHDRNRTAVVATPDGVHGKVPYRDLSKNLTEMDSAARLVSPVCSDSTRIFPDIQCAGFSVFCRKWCSVRQPGAFVSRRVDPAICTASAVTDRLIRRGEPHNFAALLKSGRQPLATLEGAIAFESTASHSPPQATRPCRVVVLQADWTHNQIFCCTLLRHCTASCIWRPF